MKNKDLIFTIAAVCTVYYFSSIYEPHREIKTQKVDDIKKSLRPIIPPNDYDRIKVFDMKEKFNNDVPYTKQKKKIWIGTKSKDGVSETKDVLTYVLIHEFAHAINANSFQHDKEFQKTFKELLDKADLAGIVYKQKDKLCGTCLGDSCKK